MHHSGLSASRRACDCMAGPLKGDEEHSRFLRDDDGLVRPALARITRGEVIATAAAEQ